MRIGEVKGISPAAVLQRLVEGDDDYYQLIRRYELLCTSAGIDDIESLCPDIDPEEFYRQFPPQPATQERTSRTSSLYRYLVSDLKDRRKSFLLDLDEKFIDAEYPGLVEFCEKMRGVGDVNRIWARWVRPLRIPGEYESAIRQRGGDTVAPHDLSMLRSLTPAAEPQVRASLVIPTYGRDDLVLRCVLSIAKSHTRPDAEILIAEDAVHVDCAWILGYFLPFTQIHKNEKNLGFLLNCNAAVQRAKGEIVVLVNNDVLVHANALVEMMRTFDERAEAAVVGGLILNVDGTVQENGGIMWNDASAWNYHRNLPFDQEHLRNVREADYVTGAWIGIRRSVWDELGGFDTRYVPAYCEEADMCLAVTSRGYKVYVNPLSVVTHLEGATMGTDEKGSTLKAYQVANQKKLFAKWHPVLSTAHNPNGNVTPFHTGRSNKNRFVTVVFDHYLPEYDRDAGSRTMFAVCQALASIENNYVVFVPANTFRSRYAPALERLGIETITGSEGWKRFDNLLANHLGMIRHAFVSRIEIARKYAWHLDQMKCTKSLYIHDIDTLRAFSYTPDAPGFEKLTQVAIGEYVKRNNDVFAKFQNIVSCSEDETALLRPYLGDRLVNLFPYDYQTTAPDAAAGMGKDMVFVGSYNHGPNREGIDWFLREVWPLTRMQLPEARLHVVGSGFENATFPNIDSHIVVHGQVTDQTLDYLYATCKLSIAPLLAGAGIKGKLIEACARGIPCVGTAAAWQGLQPPAGYEYLSGSNESFADRLVQAYMAAGEESARDLIAYYEQIASRDQISKVIPALVRATLRKGRA
jgi:GT2 family glycosyltransferase